jgi:hypothetical protein
MLLLVSVGISTSQQQVVRLHDAVNPFVVDERRTSAPIRRFRSTVMRRSCLPEAGQSLLVTDAK